jgi:hypothetical protein
MRKAFILVFVFIYIPASSYCQADFKARSKPQIDSIAISNWIKLGSFSALSNNGKFVSYNINRGSYLNSTLIVALSFLGQD